MKLKIASFNISGGFYGGDESTEYLDREAVDGVDDKFSNEIIKLINENNIDIICFQEVITTKRVNYIKSIMENTDLKYYDDFELSPCNIVKDTEFGVGILSRYPIINSIKEKFTNPKLTKTTSSGNTYYLYDKGYLLCHINVDNEMVKVLNHHGFPFRRFNSSPELNKPIFEEFDSIIQKCDADVIVGDFNAENFMNMMEYTNKNYMRTINTVTTVDGMKFDDIVVKKGKDYTTNLIKSLSDHYLVITEVDF